MKVMWTTVAVAAVALAVSAQADPVHYLDQAVASELIRGAVGNQAAGALQNSPDLQKAYTASVIEQELAQEAARRGLAERLDVQRMLMQTRYQILLQALREDVARNAQAPTADEIKQAFKKEPGKWVMPEAYKLDIFAVDSSSVAGVDMLKAARSSSRLDAAKLTAGGAKMVVSSAGEQWVAERDITPEDWKGISAMPQDGMGVFNVQNVVLLVKRGDHRDKKAMTLDQATGAIRNEMLQQRQQETWESFLQDHRKRLGLQ